MEIVNTIRSLRWRELYVNCANLAATGLYTDESPGLKVDPVVVMTLSVVFIFSVVALHGTSIALLPRSSLTIRNSHRQDHAQVLRISATRPQPPSSFLKR